MEAKIKARAAAFGRAKTGSQQVCIEFYVMTGKYKEETLMYYGNLSPNAIANTVAQLELLGWSGDVTDTDSMLRNAVKGRILETELESGRVVAKVDWVFPLERELTKDPLGSVELMGLQDLVAKSKRQREPGEEG